MARCLASLVLVTLVAAELDCDEVSGTQLLQVSLEKRSRRKEAVSLPSSEGYFWVKRGGDAMTSSSTPFTAPSNFSGGPTWFWGNPLGEQVRHSPLIDDKHNIYVTTHFKVRKFNSDGKILWTYNSRNRMTTSPALYKGSLITMAHGKDDAAQVVALSIDKGDVLWNRTMESGRVNGDSQSLLAYNSTVLLPLHTGTTLLDKVGEHITNTWHALDASNGSSLWEYQVNEGIWNAVPSTPGDGSLLFAGSCGGAFRLTFDGKLMWRAGAKKLPILTFCSTGGGSVGPNGVFYTEYTRLDQSGHVSAYNISDGSLLWEKNFGRSYGGGQYPAVGKLSDGRLAVVVAIGDNPGLPPWGKFMNNSELHDAYLSSPSERKKLGVPKMKNAVVAMDAESGKVLWRWEEDIWDHFAAAGDEGKEALQRLVTKSPEHDICLPDLQGIPLISGDGTVYASSSHGGDLTAIRDTNGDGIIDKSEISTFVTKNAFLNSPSLAPGMLVAAPCWGPMYVFKA